MRVSVSIATSVALCGLLAGCDDSQKTGATVTVTQGGGASSQPTSEPSRGGRSENGRTEVSMNQSVIDGGYRFQLASYTTPTSISLGQYKGTLHPQPHTSLALVIMKVTNLGNGPRPVPFCGHNGAVLIASNLKNHSWNETQSIKLPSHHKLCGYWLQVGEPRKIPLVFDVPNKAGKIIAIAVWDSTDMNDILDGKTYGVIDLK